MFSFSRTEFISTAIDSTKCLFIKNARFNVTAMFEEPVKTEASEVDTEISTFNDNATDFLSKEELNYFLSLKEL